MNSSKVTHSDMSASEIEFHINGIKEIQLTVRFEVTYILKGYQTLNFTVTSP